MRVPPRPVALALAALLSASSAQAQQASPALPGCDGTPAACLDAALAPCHAEKAETPALASRCYRDAQARFSDAIAARMRMIGEAAPETLAAVAGIEVKYDLVIGLAQCDRMAELALLGEASLPEIQRRKDGCTATAVGLALLRLHELVERSALTARTRPSKRTETRPPRKARTMIEEPAALSIVTDRRRPSQAQVDAFRGVPTGFLCDAMEGLGALPGSIAPVGGLRDPALRVAGPALVADNGPAEILATLAAVTLARPGDVVVASVAGWQGCSACGDQVLGMMRNAGCAGFITDGPMRDYEGIAKVGLPAWCSGLNPNSPYGNGPGRVGGAAVLGGVRVETGDMIVADCNGVVVVPFARIDGVIAALAHVAQLEADLEAKVADGFRHPLDLDAMLSSGRAVEV